MKRVSKWVTLLDDETYPHLEQWAVGLTPCSSLTSPQRLMNSWKLVLHGGVWQVYNTLTPRRETGDSVFHGFLKFGGDKIKVNILPLCGTTRHWAPPFSRSPSLLAIRLLASIKRIRSDRKQLSTEGLEIDEARCWSANLPRARCMSARAPRLETKLNQ